MHVTDPSGNPVAGASVSLGLGSSTVVTCVGQATFNYCQEESVSSSRDVNGNAAITDANGNVSLYGIGNGSVTVSPPAGLDLLPASISYTTAVVDVQLQ